MGPYADLHLHLIPDVDDGPATDEEAIELARLIVADGVSQLAVTPHFNAWNPKMLAGREELEDRLVALRDLLKREDVDLTVFPGAEHFLTPELLDLVAAGQAPTLGPGPYILVELPFTERPLYADDLLYQLSLAGLQPVLAHPERYSWVGNDPNLVEPLVARGIILQLTAASLNGGYGGRIKKVAEFLLRQGWYSLVGSDVHHPEQNRLLSEMEANVRAVAGEEAARVLFRENPQRVLLGEPLLPVPAGDPGTSRKRLFGLFG